MGSRAYEARAFRRTTGTVTAFDDDAGLGTIADAEGHEWFFHCTAIADGSRRIEVGTPVDFATLPGHRGMFEARDIRPV